MFRFLKNRRRLFWLTVVAVPLILFSYGAWRWHTVAKLQRSLQRNYEVDFNGGGKPAAMPGFLDEWFWDYFEEKRQRGELRLPLSTHTILERIRVLFRGPVRSLEIFYPDGIDEKLGPALENFPNLEFLFIEELAYQRADFERVIPPLFDSLGRLKRLRELQIFDSWFGMEQIREVAGFRSLDTLTLEMCRMPEGFVAELARSSSLKQLTLIDVEIDRELTKKEREAGEKRDPFAEGASREDPRKWKPSPEELEMLSRAGINLEWE